MAYDKLHFLDFPERTSTSLIKSRNHIIKYKIQIFVFHFSHLTKFSAGFQYIVNVLDLGVPFCLQIQ